MSVEELIKELRRIPNTNREVHLEIHCQDGKIIHAPIDDVILQYGILYLQGSER